MFKLSERPFQNSSVELKTHENRDALIENRDALIENRDALIENRDVVIANRVSVLDSILDSRFMQGSRIECQLTFERYSK